MRQSVNNKITKFTNNDILSSSAWSSVIHQPSQDSEPEDLPSTVDINAIKEFSTPVNAASAQTPLHGDSNSGTLSDDQNAGESGTDSDSESDSGNSENEIENLGSGADSASCSDSDSISSHRSSRSSSRSKPRTSHSSRSNSPTIVDDASQKTFMLPKDCNLSEDDSDDGSDLPSIPGKDSRNTDFAAKKSAFPRTNNSENLQIPNEADSASVLPDAKSTARTACEGTDFSNVTKKSSKPAVETKKIPSAFSDSSSDSEMLPKQVVRDAINSICVEPRSPYDSNDGEERIAQEPFKPHKPLAKDVKDASKISSYLSTPVDGHTLTNANLCASFEMFHGQEKRGPGRPRKNRSDTKIAVAKEQCKNKNKNSVPATTATPSYPSVSPRVCNATVAALPTQIDCLRKHKKRKKKDTKEKTPNPEFAKEIDELTDFFCVKCIIEDRRLSCVDTSFPRHLTITRSKMNQRNKDKSRKRKLSDKDSESETTYVLPHDVKTKRRHKKSTTETPKVHRTNCDQRLPLKKRHYHVSAPSVGQNASHQAQSGWKVRGVEKQTAAENSNEECPKAASYVRSATSSSPPTSPSSSSVKPNEFCNLPPTLSSIKKERYRKRTKNVDSDLPPVLDEYSRQPNSRNENTLSSKSVSALLATNSAPSSASTSTSTLKTPELITPLPKEPSSDLTWPNLKPPAGVFEPTRKLPVAAAATSSSSSAKRISIDDTLCKANERLKELASPSSDASALIEVGESVCEDEEEPPFKRVLRRKKTHVEKEKETETEKEKEKEKEKENTGKKSKILKDVSICLLKLPIADSSNSNANELQDTDKPKVVTKRRKTRNRTGFPILKKKKKKRLNVAASPSHVLKEDNGEKQSKIRQSASEAREFATKEEKNRDEESAEVIEQTERFDDDDDDDDVSSILKEKPASRGARKMCSKKNGKTAKKAKLPEADDEGPKKIQPTKKERIQLRERSGVSEELIKTVEPANKEKLEERENNDRIEDGTKKTRAEGREKCTETEEGTTSRKLPPRKKENAEGKEKLVESGEGTRRIQSFKKERNIEEEEMVEETPSRSLRKRQLPKEKPSAKQSESKKLKSDSKEKAVAVAVAVAAQTKKAARREEIVDAAVVSSGRSLRKREPPPTNNTQKSASASAVVEKKKRKDGAEKTSNATEKCREDLKDSTKEGRVKKEPKVKEDSKKDESSDDSKKDVVPRKRRKYIPAGLFSDYYKDDRCTAADLKNRYITYKCEDHPHGLLPPPPYFEEFVRRRKVEFKLPYDLWWLHTYDKLPGRDIVESWKYKRLKMNVYYDVKPPHGYEAQACNCKWPEEKDELGCGDDCINRVVYAECSPELCPLKEKCSNQRIQKHNADSTKLCKFMTKDKGIGVKTQKLIKAGEYIVEYVGEVVTDKEFKNRMTSLYKNDIHHYCLNLEGGLLIDGHRMGSDARFVNHSCEPNCEIQKWSVKGRFRMGLFAQRDIEPGEELTYDYNFSLFNPEEGQPCRCGSKECRGVIGGKSQRVSVAGANANNGDASAASLHAPPVVSNGGQTGKNSVLSCRPRKQTRKNSNVNVNMKNFGRRRDSDSNGRVLPRRSASDLVPMESLTSDEKQIVRAHRVLMPRNLTKIQRIRERMKRQNADDKSKKQNSAKNDKSKQPIEFMRQLNALTQQRFIKTRGLAQVEDDPEMNKTLQLANLFRTIYTCVISAKDENTGEAFSSLFISLPSKQKLPMYYQRIEEPIDLTTVERNIVTGVYKDVESFDKDMNKLIANNVKYYGRTSEHGIAAIRLRKAYNIAKLDHIKQVEEITGQMVPTSFRPVQENPGDEEEDVIRCICGLYNDEGMMIQCERCLVWQHIGCVKANTDVEHYYCERCSSREVDYEVPLDVPPPDYPEPNEKHFLTLMREDLQIRQGDTVYVLRDLRDPATNARHTYRTIGTFKYDDCDILRVDQLWKTRTGEKFAFGHHYLRPCETFHEPTRKFFPNELLKRSVYETVPLDLIMGRCYVLDLRTYCRGRPIDADPEHIYICEYSVNKDMNTFHKMKSKQPCPVSMKSYAFEMYDTRLRVTRTYTPHVVPPPTSNHATTEIEPPKLTPATNQNKGRASKPKEVLELQRVVDTALDHPIDEDDSPLVRSKDSKVDQRKQRLNIILLKLLAKKPCKSPLDVSYLLEMGRRNRTSKKPVQQGANNPT